MFPSGPLQTRPSLTAFLSASFTLKFPEARPNLDNPWQVGVPKVLSSKFPEASSNLDNPWQVAVPKVLSCR